jgi:hypothetical protein
MSTSECFKLTSLEKKHFLLGKDNLSADEWRYVFDTVVAQLKTEPDIGWKNYDPDTPSTIVLIWNV